jgi:hypothetical protein
VPPRLTRRLGRRDHDHPARPAVRGQAERRPEIENLEVRIPAKAISQSGVFDHPRSEAAKRPTRGLTSHPLTITSFSTLRG